MAQGVIVLASGQHATYIVRGDFNYYVQMAANSKVTFRAADNGANVNINYNIWGPGSATFDCNATVKASIGSAPAQSAINGLQVFQYRGKPNFTELIGWSA